MNRYLLAKQDLATFHKRDLDTLAGYYNLSGSGGDLLWILAYKIHTNRRAPMPPGCLNKYDIIIGDEDIPEETLVRSNGVCWDADTLVDYITKTALRNEYPADAYYTDHEDQKVALAGKPIYDSKTLEEIYDKASPENVKKLQDFISQLAGPSVLTPEIMELVKKTGAILQARGPIFIEWITSRWPEDLIKDWLSKVHTQTDLEPPRGMSKELKNKLGFDKAQILGEFHEQYRDWGLQVKTQLAALDHRLKEDTLYECVSGTFCMKMMGMYFLDAYNKWAVENGQAVYEYTIPDDYSALRIQYNVPEPPMEEPLMEVEGFRSPFEVDEYIIEPGAELENAALGAADLGYANLEGANLRGAELQGTNFDNANLIGATLEDADLEGAYLGGARLVGANLKGANFMEANLERATLQGAELQRATFFDAELFEVDLSTANLTSANFGGADIQGSDLTNAILTDAVFQAANLIAIKLQGADLTGANLVDSTFIGGDLTGATLVNTKLGGTDLELVVFTNAVITDADFTGANLKDTNFINVSMTNVDFTNANLTRANLTGVTLTNANFTNANLTDAYFTNATLTNTTFTGADTTGTQF